MIEIYLYCVLGLFALIGLFSIWLNLEIGKPHIIKERKYKSEYWGNKKEKNKINNFDNIDKIIASKYERN